MAARKTQGVDPPHGTVSRYRSRKWQCRCDACREAQKLDRRERWKFKPAHKAEHGTRRCYLNGCREPECVQANRDYQREYMRGRRARGFAG